jgi:hypothetical protein
VYETVEELTAADIMHIKFSQEVTFVTYSQATRRYIIRQRVRRPCAIFMVGGVVR